MINNSLEKNLYVNTLEIHYNFKGFDHTMDALVHNRCEYEVIGILQEISRILGSEVTIETEPLGVGGLRKWLSVAKKQEDKNATITVTIITAIVFLFLITPATELLEQLVERQFEDKELIELTKEKLRLEIEKLKGEKNSLLNELDTNLTIKKKKSNFYQHLEKYHKVDNVSFTTLDESKKYDTKEITIKRNEFKSFILITDLIKPMEDQNAIIEIISPVLKKGQYKWNGIYEGNSIKFSMKSDEFNSLVQSGQVEFKNGSSIECHLIINRKVNSEGMVIITSYEALRVNKYFENENPIETKEGRSYRINSEELNKNKQLQLFSNDNI